MGCPTMFVLLVIACGGSGSPAPSGLPDETGSTADTGATTPGTDTDTDTDSLSHSDSDSAADTDTDTDTDTVPEIDPVLFINEFVADNAESAQSESGATPDWIELFNPTEAAISLGGWTMTDDLDEPEQHVFEDGLEIGPGGFLLLWADALPLLGANHLSFSLDKAGEQIGLFDPQGIPADRVTFEQQVTDVAAARMPDGGPDWTFVLLGTPGASNVPVAVTTLELIGPGSTWAYLDSGVYPGDSWVELKFPDAAWATGPGPLGYGDAHQVTIVDYGPDSGAKHVTTWFRHVFAFDGSAGTLHGAEMRLMVDDGAVVYLNGVEVLRHNIAAPSDASTYADGAVPSADESNYLDFDTDASGLQVGQNVVAAEVHQASAGSSDLTFDLAFEVVFTKAGD